ncbi:MAG: hypothetical protein IKH21_03375 [Clostridia bacterium]|nr:hypothetical protein [Clostridia bacterium]
MNVKKKSAFVFETAAVNIDEEYVNLIEKNIGFGKCTITDNDKTMCILDDKGNSIMVFKASGSMTYSAPDEGDMLFNEAASPFSDEEYKRIADDWLSHTGLLTDEYTEKDAVVADNGFVTKTDDDGTEHTYPTFKTVTYPFHDLEGIEVGGVAPRIAVDVTLDGRIKNVVKIQREYKPLAEYPLQSIEKAIQKLKDGEGVFYVSDNAGQKGIIENVKLAYYNTDVMDDCPYLLPVYIFEGTSEGSQFTAMVYALEEDCYTVTGGTT